MTRYILIFAIIFFSLCGCHQQQEEEIVSVPADTLPSLVTHIRQCSRIYTTEYKIHKIVTHDDVIRLKGTFLAQDFNLKMPLGDLR